MSNVTTRQADLPVPSERPDWLRFLAAWLRAPLRTGAIAPSSEALAAQMAFCAALRPGMRVLELGPGTGVVTQAILSAGVKQADITLVEADPHLARLLTQRFPLARVLCGDAFATVDSLREERADIQAVVSSLPLLVYPAHMRRAICRDALELVGRHGRMVQFTYGLTSPIGSIHGIARTPSRRVWANLPPAVVWTYRAAPVPSSQEGEVLAHATA